MADNVNVTAGTGTVIATDQVGADHYQKIKLADGTADSSTMVAVDIGAKANALRVAPANDITDATYIGDIKFGESLPAGTALMGKVSIDQITANANEVVIKSGTVTTVSSVTAIANALPAGDNNIGNVDIVTVPAPLNVVGGGAEATALRVTIANDSTGVVSVDDGGSTLTIDGTVTASNTAGNIAHDEIDSGNPVKIGCKAYNFDGTAPGTAVAEGDRANCISDIYGRQFVETIHPNYGTANDNQAAAQTKTALVGTPGAGLSIYVTDIIMSTDTAGNIKLVEDTAVAGTDIKGPYYFAANGGMAISLKAPLKLSANVDLGYTSTMAGNHTVEIGYFIAP